jgi:hypothetical protein
MGSNMKKFTEYLTESKKIYEFKVGIAGELPENCADSMESCLQKFGLESMSSPKKTPIQERPLDFPQLQNCECHYYDIAVQYPTTPQVMGEYLSSCCNIDPAYIIVRSKNAPQEEYQDKEYNKVYEPKLGSDIDNGQSAQEDVGTNRTMNLLAELEKARKERDNDPGQGVKGNTEQKQMALNEPEESKSPVGSK